MLTIDLSDDVVVVTGAAGSIGTAIVKTLTRAGATVIATDVTLEGVQTLADSSELGPGLAVPRVMDVTSTDSVDSAFGWMHDSGYRVTGLVNAAGILRVSEIASMSDAAWDEIVNVNVSGTFRTTRAAARSMKRQGRGSIVNLSSVSAFIGSADGAAYSSTKGAVLSFTYGTAGELAPFGIRVNAVSPGWVDGGFTHQALADAEDPEALADLATRLHPLGRMASPQDVSDAVVWLLSPMSAFVTGSSVFVDGGFMVQRGLRA